MRTDFSDAYRIVGHKPLGVGLTSEVWKAIALGKSEDRIVKFGHIALGSLVGEQEVAAKLYREKQPVVSIEQSATSMPKALKREVEFLAAVSGHPNVMRFCGVFLLGGGDGGEDQADSSDLTAPSPQWCLCMEFCSSDLYSVVKACRLQEEEAKKVMRSILSALAHIHALGILHRDVKVENVMIRQDGSHVLSDFGLSCRMSDTRSVMLPCGSPGYIPPEVIVKKGWQEESDVFSAGVMLFVTLAGRVPFEGSDVKDTCLKTVQSRLSFAKYACFTQVSSQLKLFLRLLLKKCPEHRPRAFQSLQEDWLAEDAARIPSTMCALSTRASSTETDDSFLRANLPAEHSFEPICVIQPEDLEEPGEGKATDDEAETMKNEVSRCPSSRGTVSYLSFGERLSRGSWIPGKTRAASKSRTQLAPKPKMIERLQSHLRLPTFLCSSGARGSSAVVPQPSPARPELTAKPRETSSGSWTSTSSAPAAGRPSGFSSLWGLETADIDQAYRDTHQTEGMDPELREIMATVANVEEGVPRINNNIFRRMEQLRRWRH